MLVSLAQLLEQGSPYSKPGIKPGKPRRYKAPRIMKKKDRSGNVGALIRHCMAAVAPKKGGIGKKGAEAAWNICRWAMTKYKFLKGPYKKGAPPSPYTGKVTARGARRNMKHAMGACPRGKSNKSELRRKQMVFTKLFKHIDK